MAKPMLVTLPFVLLLMDYWPLQRFEPKKSAQADPYRGKQAGSGKQGAGAVVCEKKKGQIG